MTITDSLIEEPNPRICMPTRRGIRKQVFNCSIYEAEDVLAETAGADLICLEPGAGFEWRNRWVSRLAFRDLSGRSVLANPGVKRVRLTQDYDLFVAICQTYEDLLYLNGIEGWQDRCRTSVCWIDEVWINSIHKYRHWMSALRRFDHVFVGLRGSVEPLSEAIGRPCHWITGAVDMIRFSPHHSRAPRVIDVYSIGRRFEGLHQAFQSMALKNEIFYLHDTFAAAGASAYDHREHRQLFARLLQRSRYFVVAPAKMDAMGETNGQIEVGYRYYEGAAAGAVMIGQAAACDSFQEMFGWQDAVIEIQPDGSDLREVLRSLDAQPQRLYQIRQRNITQSLLKHDWVHRWQRIFEVAGVKPSLGMIARAEHLKDLAECTVAAAVG